MMGEAGKHNGLGGGFVPPAGMERKIAQLGLSFAGFGLAPSEPWVGQPARTDVRASLEPVSFGGQEASRGNNGETQSKEKQETAHAAKEINEAVSKLDAAIAAAGHSAELVKHLSSQRDHLVALKSQLALGFRSGAGLTELLQQVHAATTSARQDANTAIAGGSVAGLGAHISSVEYQRAAMESRNWLHSTAEQFEKRNAESFGLANKYGIDVSEEQKKLEDAKKREKEALAKGDITGALDARIDGNNVTIGINTQVINNPNVSDKDKAKAQALIDAARKDNEDAQAKKAKIQEKQRAEKVAKGEMTPEESEKQAKEESIKAENERSRAKSSGNAAAIDWQTKKVSLGIEASQETTSDTKKPMIGKLNLNTGTIASLKLPEKLEAEAASNTEPKKLKVAEASATEDKTPAKTPAGEAPKNAGRQANV